MIQLTKYLSTDETTEGKSRELASVYAPLVEMSDVKLHGSMILGGDQTVGGGATNIRDKYQFHIINTDNIGTLQLL